MKTMGITKGIIVGTIIFSFLCLEKVQSQIPWSKYDYMELELKYASAFGGYKMMKLVQVSSDSCFYEYYESNERNATNWYQDTPIAEGTISCAYFDSVITKFDNINNSEILLHHKNLIISDGFMVTLTLSNLNSSVAYRINTPRKKDEHLDDFKETATMMLNLDEKSWNKWIK